MLVSTSARMGFGGESPVTIGRLVEPVGLHLLMTAVSAPYDEVINDLNPKKKTRYSKRCTTHLLGPNRSAFPVSSATMARKS